MWFLDTNKVWLIFMAERWSQCESEIVSGLCHKCSSEGRAFEYIRGASESWRLSGGMRGGLIRGKLPGVGQAYSAAHEL